MKISDIIKTDSRVWIKPEWSPISDYWPAISFTLFKVASDLANTFRMDKDLMISVGTTNAEEVAPEHRSKLLSVTRFTSKQARPTSEIVPEKSWKQTQAKYPNQWKWGFPVTELWEFTPHVNAHDFIAEAYKKFATLRGRPVELTEEEINNISQLQIIHHPVSHRQAAKVAISQQTLSELDAATKRDISRLTNRVIQRIQQSGEEVSRVMPVRSTSPDIDMMVILSSLWKQQDGLCTLCHAPIEIEPSNRLLQMSADRIESEIGMYDESNMHITHLACNLAKNKFSVEEFQEWLEIASSGYMSKAESQDV